ncbi:MAG: alpha/beta fold hydrolase [Parvibaculum sp.]
MATFLLVHGAWHGAWCWKHLVAELEARGHRTHAIDLPGNGEDTLPLAEVTLENCAERVVDAAALLPERPILVGHSMGGGVISTAAELRPEVFRRLVYLTAFLPIDGKSLLEISEDPTNEVLPKTLVYNDDRISAGINPEYLRKAFYADCSEEDIAYAQANLCTQALAPFVTPLKVSGARYGSVPRDFITCRQDEAITYALQQKMMAAVPCENVGTLESSHSPFFSAPQVVADLLIDFAR